MAAVSRVTLGARLLVEAVVRWDMSIRSFRTGEEFPPSSIIAYRSIRSQDYTSPKDVIYVSVCACQLGAGRAVE
jgi:hypothetical protein